jgi:hypothetical protein
MININKKYTTRNGNPVKIFMTDAGGKYPVIGAILDPYDNHWEATTWTEDGIFNPEHSSNCRDLVLVKVKKTRQLWVSIYPTGEYLHNSKEDADKNAYNTRLACIPVTLEWEEEG